MCGIAAIFAYRPDAADVERAELVALREAMRARGPDGEGAWIAADGRVGLAHRRLAIIDLSEDAAQPMDFANGRYRITYNGEIYNFRALREGLESQGRVFTTESDTEVLLHLYDAHGADMVHELRGMYAFALWDEAKQGLLLARDPFGIKPLYYADDGKTLRVASQVKALLGGGRVDGAADAAGHVGFFLFGYVPEPHTLYRAVRALPAGHTLWVDAAGTRRMDRYFDVAEAFAESADGPPADLRAALSDSVRHHLVADVPVGVFLSAGLDSATIVGLASECHGVNLDTMTLGFEEFRDSPRDETPLAEEVARTYGTRHRTEWVAGAAFRDHLTDVFAAMDQPTIDGVNVFFVAKAAASLGLKVAMSGLGGDELFGGYDSFRQIPALVGGLGRLPGLRALGRGVRIVSAPVAKRLTSPKAAGLLEYGTTYGDAYLLRRGLFMPWELADVLEPDMAREGWRALQPLVRLEDCASRVSGPRRKVAALEMAWYMRNQLLRDADWAGMAHSLEIRVPFVDAQLFRSLVPHLGRPGGPDKGAMALTPATPLPGAVLARPKSGFSIPVRDWLHGGAGNGRGERGLRGWARRVYREATAAGSEPLVV